MADGLRFDRVILDEWPAGGQRRELLVVRQDGTTYSADVPAAMDLGDVLDDGESVGFDAGDQPPATNDATA